MFSYKKMNNMNQSEVVGLIDFNTEYYFLAEFELFNTKIENYYLNNIVKYEQVDKYFDTFKSKNINVIIKLLQDEITIAENSKNKTTIDKAHKNIKNTWLWTEFNKEEQELFLKAFYKIIDNKQIKIMVESGIKNQEKADQIMTILSSNKYNYIIIVPIKIL